MAILKIARMGNMLLMSKAKPVADPTATDVQVLVSDMIETMHDAPGIGLAAPQVHVSLRVVVFYIPEDRAGENALPLTILINPEIEYLSEDIAFDIEGCLSLPGLQGQVPRYTHILYKGFQLDGSIIEREAKGYHARVVQHECDHLDGILYPMRMTDISQFGFSDELERSAQFTDKEG